MSDFEKLINASDLIEWIIETDPDWCVGSVRCIIDHIDKMPSAQSTEASCWGCNCQKMERLKEQKTFSEMVHLHDAETHEERMETHACDSISRQTAIDAFYKYPNIDWTTLDVLAKINALPSAQPDLSGYSDKLWQKAYERGKAEALDEIVRCKDCRFYKSDGCFFSTAETEENGFCSWAERRADEAR